MRLVGAESELVIKRKEARVPFEGSAIRCPRHRMSAQQKLCLSPAAETKENHCESSAVGGLGGCSVRATLRITVVESCGVPPIGIVRDYRDLHRLHEGLLRAPVEARFWRGTVFSVSLITQVSATTTIHTNPALRFNRHSAFAVLVFAVLLGCPLISLPSATATATAKWRQMGVPAAEHACMHERGWGSTYTHDVRAPPLGYGSVFWRSWARVIRGMPIVGRPNADTLHQPRPARRPRTRTAERLLAGPRRRAGPQVHPPPRPCSG